MFKAPYIRLLLLEIRTTQSLPYPPLNKPDQFFDAQERRPSAYRLRSAYDLNRLIDYTISISQSRNPPIYMHTSKQVSERSRYMRKIIHPPFARPKKRFGREISATFVAPPCSNSWYNSFQHYLASAGVAVNLHQKVLAAG